ncbi:MAG: AAA family ATPase [Planctomycetes bacterium]|nr:AAA family ATPase [Planctomycetota bacterium]
MLIVDEASMLSADVVGVVEQLVAHAGAAHTLTVVYVGDMAQLLPVDGAPPTDADAWPADVLTLAGQHRTLDAALADALRQLRAVGDERLQVKTLPPSLRARCVRLADIGDVTAVTGATFCFGTRAAVARHNDALLDAHLARTGARAVTFVASDAAASPSLQRALDAACAQPSRVRLAVGARVRLTANMRAFAKGMVTTVDAIEQPSPTAPNGAVVVRFGTEVLRLVPGRYWCLRAPAVDGDATARGRVLASRKTVPLALAYATTVHGLQGDTIADDTLYVDTRSLFGGVRHLYTAASRVRRLEQLRLVV